MNNIFNAMVNNKKTTAASAVSIILGLIALFGPALGLEMDQEIRNYFLSGSVLSGGAGLAMAGDGDKN